MEQYLYFGSLGLHERQYQVPNFIGLALNPAHDREMAHDLIAPLPFADGVIAYEGNWLGGETFVSFDKKAVALLTAQGQSTRLL